VVLAGVRGVVALAAIPLAPLLYREHFVVLVLMRPTKEVLLAAGFLIRLGRVGLLPTVLAALPLIVLGVWLFYFLGRQCADAIVSGKGLGRTVRRILHPDRVATMRDLVERKGEKVVFIGRLAAFPSTAVAAAAGSAGMPARRFLLVDALGAVAALAEVLVAGYLLGHAYDRAGPWIAGAGLVALVAVAVIVTRALRRD